MQRPSLFDHIIGHPLVLLAECGLGLDLAIRFLGSEPPPFAVVIFVAVPFAISSAARARVIDWREHQREWQAMLGSPATPAAFMRLRRIVPIATMILLGPAAVEIIWSFLVGWTASSGRSLPPLRSLVPSIVLDYPLMLYGYAVTVWMHASANPGYSAIAIGAAALAYGLVRIGRRRLRRSRARRVESRGGWDGTVQVLLPVPKEPD